MEIHNSILTRTFEAICIVSCLIIVGSGCDGRQTYERAREANPVRIEPNRTGALASTGGHETTVTPQMPTERLVQTLPDTLNAEFRATSAPIEHTHPIPLPDGTRSAYTSVTRDYEKQERGKAVHVRVTVSDTRGIPVLYAFMKSFTEYRNEDGYRSKEKVRNEEGWLQYTYDPSGSEGGFGSFIMLYRERFLIQIDANAGIKESDIIRFAETIHYDPLR